MDATLQLMEDITSNKAYENGTHKPEGREAINLGNFF
jgi:hypothetical protein